MERQIRGPCQRTKKLWKINLTVIPIGALRMILRCFVSGLEELEIGGQIEFIQTTAYLRTTRILRRV